MNLWLAYNIVLVLGLVIALAWAYDARRYAQRASRLVSMRDCDLPTEEIPLPATMKIGPRLEEFGPGKPVPAYAEDGMRTSGRSGIWPNP